MNEQELRALMTEVDARPAPAGRCDAAALVAAGRVAARRRRVGTSALAVVAVLAVTGGAVAVSRMVGAARPAPQPAAPPQPTVPPQPGPMPAGRGFDPLVRTAALGWVPAGLPVRFTELSADRQEYYAEPAAGHVPADVATVGLVLHRSGWQPDHPKRGDCRRGTSDGTVGGTPAYRLASPYPPGSSAGTINCDVGLMWQYAPGYWAESRVLLADIRVPASGSSAPPPAGHLQVARRVAENAVFGRHDRIRLPFTVSGLPAGYRLAGSAASTGSPDSAEIAGDGMVRFTDGRGGRTSLGCTVTDATHLVEVGGAITTIDGHPATFIGGEPAQLFVVGVRGCKVSVERDGSGSRAELTALYRTVRPVATPRDQAGWTDHPLG